MNDTTLTLDMITNHLGEPVKRVGSEYFWQCPLCQDSGRDNLKYNDRKNFLTCFASDWHGRRIYGDIFKQNGSKYPKHYKKPTKTIVEPVITKAQAQEFQNYMLACNDALLVDTKALDFLYNKRGLTYRTVAATGLGVDRYKKLWIIPTIKYNCTACELMGFEFRPLDLSKNGLHRTKDTPNGMAMINCWTPKTEVLCIIEGYFDGYALLQYLKEQEQSKYYHIATPSNGVQSLLKYMPQVDFGKYKKHYLYIDNDDTSSPKAVQILEKYPFFELVTMPCGCKDFNEHYLKCIIKRRD